MTNSDVIDGQRLNGLLVIQFGRNELDMLKGLGNLSAAFNAC
ncbi:hypothetical protein SynBIOSE41_00951 [Synechococcus sp. BIOS-E4-1]|nr:hypothetical protein SynBIOSE41_00951 [Synechococcus sp. BIOS-E4-1]